MKRQGSAVAPARTASDLIASGAVSPAHVYAATLVLARLQDRGIGFALTLEEMCEVLGYLGQGRRPPAAPSGRGGERREAR